MTFKLSVYEARRNEFRKELGRFEKTSEGEDINKAQARYSDQDWLRKAQIVKKRGVRDEVVAIPSDEMQ